MSAISCHFWANLSASFSTSLFRYRIILFVNKIYHLFYVYTGVSSLFLTGAIVLALISIPIRHYLRVGMAQLKRSHCVHQN